jgi:hypothetical protein
LGELGEGVGGHDRLGRLHPRLGGKLAGQALENAVEFGGVERFADHAGRGEKDFGGFAPHGAGGDFGGQFNRAFALHAGKGVGIARIDHKGTGLAQAQILPAPVDGGRRAQRTGEDAGDGGSRVEHGKQHVGAALVADSGLGGGEPHARNGGRGDIGFGSEGGDGQGHGKSSGQ